MKIGKACAFQTVTEHGVKDKSKFTVDGREEADWHLTVQGNLTGIDFNFANGAAPPTEP